MLMLGIYAWHLITITTCLVKTEVRGLNYTSTSPVQIVLTTKNIKPHCVIQALGQHLYILHHIYCVKCNRLHTEHVCSIQGYVLLMHNALSRISFNVVFGLR